MSRFMVGKVEVEPGPGKASCWLAQVRPHWWETACDIFCSQLEDFKDMFEVDASIDESPGEKTALLPLEVD